MRVLKNVGARPELIVAERSGEANGRLQQLPVP